MKVRKTVNDKRVLGIRLTGPMGCFTNVTTSPECFSYPVPTHSALKGILKSIYWKPEMDYDIHSVYVLNEIQYNATISFKETPLQAARGLINVTPLRDLDYVVETSLSLTSVSKLSERNNLPKHYSILERRCDKGQFFRLPFFGQTGFSIKKFEICEEMPDSFYKDQVIEFGAMLYDMDYKNSSGDQVRKDPKRALYLKNIIMNHGMIDFDSIREAEKFDASSKTN